MPDVTLHHGDCLEVLASIPSNSIDAVVTDPPYGLSNHTSDEVLQCLKSWISGEPFTPKTAKGGFMGKAWDAWVPGPEVWREVLRVLKPGGHALIFAGTRSMDLMSMGVRLAGFELRDSIGFAHEGREAPVLAWVYSSGFPKSADVSKLLDKSAGAERTVKVGPKPGHEDWATRSLDLQMKSLQSLQTGAMGQEGGFSRPWMTDSVAVEKYHYKFAPVTEEARQWEGWGTALKPAWEPILLARKPLEGTVINNVMTHGTGALNIDATRIESGGEHFRRGQIGRTQTLPGDEREGASLGMFNPEATFNATNHAGGRWPANVIHDGSQEVLDSFPRDAKASQSRFFYCAKPSKKERDEGTPHGNHHPTVKPVALIQYLIKLVTPPKGVVLDPFMGSGTTGKAALKDGFGFLGIEKDLASFETAQARIQYAKDSDLTTLFQGDDTE